jgi:hypothetical protein
LDVGHGAYLDAGDTHLVLNRQPGRVPELGLDVVGLLHERELVDRERQDRSDRER